MIDKEKIMQGLKSRKLMLAVGVFVITTVLLWFSKVDMGIWSNITIMSVGGYMATNAITKFAAPKGK